MGKFDQADLQNAYAWAHGKYNETVTIASRSRRIGRKIQALKKTEPPPGFNKIPDEDPYITSGLNQKANEDEDASLLGRAYIAFDQVGDDI